MRVDNSAPCRIEARSPAVHSLLYASVVRDKALCRAHIRIGHHLPAHLHSVRGRAHSARELRQSPLHQSLPGSCVGHHLAPCLVRCVGHHQTKSGAAAGVAACKRLTRHRNTVVAVVVCATDLRERK
jgi:hypothetical protein